MSQLSYLEKLLDGVEVEWLTVSEVFNLKNGYTPSKSNSEYWTNGEVPWFRMDDIRENGRILNDSLQKISSGAVKGGKLFPANSILMSTSATIGEFALISVPHLANQRFTSLTIKDSHINTFDIKFLFYYCFFLSEWCKKNTTMSSFASVDMEGFKKFLIPLPCPDNPEKSLAIQSEIVRILDKFTALTAELTAELNMRKKQYNYYRDQLLSFEEGEVEWVTLNTVANIKNGKDWKKLGPGSIPVYGSGGIMQHVDTFAYDKPTVLIPRKGSITNIFYVDEPFWNVDTIYYTELNLDKIIPKFFYYFMTTIDMMQLDTGSGRPSLTQAILNEIKIPLPTIDEQARIISLLDKFDTLTTSLQEGLPREIELRQKQYEYYRDLLLSFPKSHSNEVA
ncbi:restriction endonuclease subunit S [Providencia sp. PROV099]|uniref:restriction endonuclease subunit S n=1 Tax=Providencia sp. PROV099 TaxID=2949815 RepID=UPI00234985BD|nr:restriction endonuclease subunit S [Providencia sp. PROV099]WOB93954.1 restriction endonuclease subunit S [Providencia sp. PROV099]